MEDINDKVSRLIIKPLRHQTRVKLDDDYFANLYQLYNYIYLKIVFIDYQQFVAIIKNITNNYKSKYILDKCNIDNKFWKIRAISGHTINLNQQFIANNEFQLEENISHNISKPLRHDINYNVNDNGFGNLFELYNYIKKHPMHKDEYDYNKFCSVIEKLSKINNKRYELNKNNTDNKLWLIRAFNGHSRQDVMINYNIEYDDNLMICHATNENAFEEIKKTGLKKMNRLYIHFYNINNENKLKELYNTRNATIFIYTYVKLLKAKGYNVFKSENNVYLVSHNDDIPIKYDNETLFIIKYNFPWNI